MTTYRLPEALGGGEYEEYRHVDGGTEAPLGTVAFLEKGVVFFVGRRLLIEIKALPAEPPVGSVVECADGYMHVNRGRSWTDHGVGGYTSWAALCASHDQPLVRLVPDPFAEPVPLPWWIQRVNGRRIGVRIDKDPESIPSIFVEIDDPDAGVLDVWLPAEAARYAARALWAAADAAEATS